MSQPNTQDNLKAIILAVLAFAAFSCSDALRKLQSMDYAITDILFWQALFGMGLIITFSPLLGGIKALWKTENQKWHMARGAMMGLNTCLSLNALSLLPMVDSYTIFFLSPFITCLLFIMLFGETIGLYRWLSIFVGFAGVVIAFRPGFETLGYAHLLALSSCFTFAFSNIFARYAGRGSAKISFGFWPLFFVAIGVFTVTGGQIEYYNMQFLMAGLAIGFFYGTALIMIASSFTLADASIISPFQYTQLIFALGFGYFLFGDIPDALKITGALIISASGIFFFYRQKTAR
ncbi:MAG: DMT family transporter [Alphaproteobacteria bacterium]|nr:DMT family transporter [Alphaproteobacteria bacterium]